MEAARQLSPSLQRASPRSLLSSFPRHFLASLCLFSVPSDPPPPGPVGPHFMVEYLVSSCGLSREEAAMASRYYAHRKPPRKEKPDAVIRLLKQEGLEDAHIRRLVRAHPRVLFADPKKTLEPKIRALRDAGFSRLELAQLVSKSPTTLQLCHRTALSRLDFWRKLLGSNEGVLRTLERAPCLLNNRPEKRVAPSLSLLHELGIPEHTIKSIVVKVPGLLFADPVRLKAVVKQAKSLGASPGLRLFADLLYPLFYFNKSILDAKFRLLQSFGWSQAELLLALQRFPYVLRFSQKKLCAAMDFLLKEAGCKPSYIALHPVLLGFSIEKRLMPRHHVLQCLKMKGAHVSDIDLCCAMKMPEQGFTKKLIMPNREKLGEILESYYSATAKKTSC